MNWPRYKFSKECEPDLLEFFKAVAEQEPSHVPSSPTRKLWEHFLPIDKTIQQQINSVKEPIPEVIDITESGDEKIEDEDNFLEDPPVDVQFLSPEKSYLEQTQNTSRLNTVATAEELATEIQDLLETEELLPENIIKQFNSECQQQQLQDMFVLLGNNLNSECTLKLWNSIIAVGCLEQNIIVSYFLQYILMQKILNKSDSNLTILLTSAFDTSSDEAVTVLLKSLTETSNNTDLKKLRDNLCTLSDAYKNMVLSGFLKECAKLELIHIGTIQSLLNTHIASENLTKVVELMFNVSTDFATEKTYGKLFLEVIQVLGSNIIHCEHQVRHIIATHKSVFKTQLLRVYESCLQDRSFSQSFRI